MADRAYEHSQYTFTNFLTITEVSQLYQSASDFAQVPFSLSGGFPEAERQVKHTHVKCVPTEGFAGEMQQNCEEIEEIRCFGKRGFL